jgi:hypothetical protein
MRRMMTLILLAGLPTTAAALLPSPPSAAAGSCISCQRQTRTPAPPPPLLIGYIKDEDLVDLCGCGFEHRTGGRGYTFSSDAGGQTAWMNIDGQDVRLKQTHSSGPKRARIGSRYIERYEGEGLQVSLVEVVNRLCIPYGPECETTGYDVTITVRKGVRRQSVKARGQCGCV